GNRAEPRLRGQRVQARHDRRVARARAEKARAEGAVMIGRRRSAVLAATVLALATAAGAVLAGDAPNLLDVGIVPYMVNTRYGGAKVEGRLNLAPGASDAGLYLSGGV